MLLRPSSFMPFCTRVSSRCVPEGVAPSLDRGDEEGQGETQGSEETNLLAPVLECLRHHRIGQHGQERAAGEGLDEGDRFSAAAKRDRASTSPPRARTMRPRRSPDPWPHHPLERVWCSIRSGLFLRWPELHINRLRPWPSQPITLLCSDTERRTHAQRGPHQNYRREARGWLLRALADGPNDLSYPLCGRRG